MMDRALRLHDSGAGGGGKAEKSYRFVNPDLWHPQYSTSWQSWSRRRWSRTEMIVDIWKDTDQIVENLPIDRKYPFSSGVNIVFGCNFCSYCITRPYVRGQGGAGFRRDWKRSAGQWTTR